MSDDNLQLDQGVPLPVHDMRVEDLLRWHSVPSPLIKALSGGSLTQGLQKVLSFGKLPSPARKPLAFGGASGSGKTLVLAKLAIRTLIHAYKQGEPLPIVIGHDFTPGSIDKLEALIRPYQVPFISGYDTQKVEDAIENRLVNQAIFIDLPGICVYSSRSMNKMMKVVHAFGANLALVLPAGLDPEESADIGYAFVQHQATTLVASKMDQAGRIGGIITGAACGLTLTYGSCSSDVRKGLVPLTAPVLTNRLLTLPV